MKFRRMALCGGVMAACLLNSAVMADPFPWEDAEVTTTVLRLSGADEETYRIGHIWQGDRTEVSITIDRGMPGPDEEDQELMREMTDEPPKLSTQCGTLVAEWSVFPMGADVATIESRCWKLDTLTKTLTGTECP